jgi:hypothetical protein
MELGKTLYRQLQLLQPSAGGFAERSGGDDLGSCHLENKDITLFSEHIRGEAAELTTTFPRLNSEVLVAALTTEIVCHEYAHRLLSLEAIYAENESVCYRDKQVTMNRAFKAVDVKLRETLAAATTIRTGENSVEELAGTSPRKTSLQFTYPSHLPVDEAVCENANEWHTHLLSLQLQEQLLKSYRPTEPDVQRAFALLQTMQTRLGTFLQSLPPKEKRQVAASRATLPSLRNIDNTLDLP